MTQQVLNNAIKSIVLAVTLAIPAVCHAQTAVMTANDAINTTSFNTAGTWSPAGAPTAGTAYSTLGFLLRGPSAGAGPFVFAGDSLTVGGGNGGGTQTFSGSTANNNALIFKVAGQTLTVNNLILDAGQIRDGNGDGAFTILNGNIHVTANGGAFIAQDTNIINSAISGSGTIHIGNNGSGTAPRVIVFTSASSTFNGNILMDNGGAGATHSRLNFAAGSIMNFTIGATGVNNDISGSGILTLDGNFAFDLSGAGSTIGNSWDIVDPTTTTTYDPTFSINGFTKSGTLWDETANGVDYDFSQTTGLLTVQAVPEPSTLALCGLGLAGLAGWKRRNK